MDWYKFSKSTLVPFYGNHTRALTFYECLADNRLPGADFCAAVQRFKKVHAQLPQALADTHTHTHSHTHTHTQVHAQLPQALAELENRVEDSRPLTQHLTSVKNRMLSLLPPATEDLTAPPDARALADARAEHWAAQQRLASAREEVDWRWGHARLKEGLRLRARCVSSSS